jgi:hypothetical protein
VDTATQLERLDRRYSAAGHTDARLARCSELGENSTTKAPADIRLGEVVNHYDAFVRALPDRPI